MLPLQLDPLCRGATRQSQPGLPMPRMYTWTKRLSFATIALSIASPALAHHVMGGATPVTFGQGFLSGLAHPVIGLDHLAVVVAVGCLAAAHRAGAGLIGGFVLAMILGVSFMAVVAVIFVALPSPLIALYTTDIAVLTEGARLLWLAAAFAVFDAVQTIATGALRGLGLTRIPMLSNLFGYWAFGLPVGIALCFWKGWGVDGIWVGLTAALIVIASALFFYWRSRSAALVSGEFAAQPATLETH